MSSHARCASFGRMPALLLPVLSVAFLLTISVSSSVEAVSNFTIKGDQYACFENIICLGDAHVYTGVKIDNIFHGTLSIAHDDYFEEQSAGIAYYHEPVRLLDPRTQSIASFNTSFQFFEEPYTDDNGTGTWDGDGMAFVISSDNSTVGAKGGGLGFFQLPGLVHSKSVVVEFDSFYNAFNSFYNGGDAMFNDLNNNHVGIDINNITSVAQGNASELGIHFFNETVVYAWVEFSAESHMLEVRISQQKFRPSSPFLSKKLNLIEGIEEYMWVGFSGSNGNAYSAYYVGDWSFEAYGIPPEDSSNKSPSRSRWGSLRYIAAITVSISAFAVALLLVLALRFYRKKRSQGREFPLPLSLEDAHNGLYENGKFHWGQDGYRFTYDELSVATGGFADEAKLGQGGFGSVYRGQLPKSNFPVAVKRISRESLQGEREFRAEVSIISQIRHRNLIRLLGWCIEDGKYYIVYDLMPNGSLDKVLLTSDQESKVLSWPQRFKVIRDIATAVEYLHHGWSQQVIHRDIKSSNVMLDEQWNAALGDFGLARLTNHQQTPNTTRVAGTPGYIAPEAAASGRFTEKSDVFAFGAVALEVACGRRALNWKCAEPEEYLLVEWVWNHLSKGDLLSVVDIRLEEYDREQMETLLLLGLICSHPDPAARPPIRLVVQVLYGETPVPMVPVAKPSPTYACPSRAQASKVAFSDKKSDSAFSTC